jgi:hypothetical protein
MEPINPEMNAEQDPVAVYLAEALITPGIDRFTQLRPDATDVEVKAAGQLLVLTALALTRLSRLQTGLETATLQPGTDGTAATDYVFAPTDRDTVEGRKAAAVTLGYVTPTTDQAADVMEIPVPAVPTESEEQTTSCRFGHFGNYI